MEENPRGKPVGWAELNPVNLWENMNIYVLRCSPYSWAYTVVQGKSTKSLKKVGDITHKAVTAMRYSSTKYYLRGGLNANTMHPTLLRLRFKCNKMIRSGSAKNPVHKALELVKQIHLLFGCFPFRRFLFRLWARFPPSLVVLFILLRIPFSLPVALPPFLLAVRVRWGLFVMVIVKSP